MKHHSKGPVMTTRYFGEFHHLDGSPACDGDFELVESREGVRESVRGEEGGGL